MLKLLYLMLFALGTFVLGAEIKPEVHEAKHTHVMVKPGTTHQGWGRFKRRFRRAIRKVRRRVKRTCRKAKRAVKKVTRFTKKHIKKTLKRILRRKGLRLGRRIRRWIKRGARRLRRSLKKGLRRIKRRLKRLSRSVKRRIKRNLKKVANHIKKIVFKAISKFSGDGQMEEKVVEEVDQNLDPNTSFKDCYKLQEMCFENCFGDDAEVGFKACQEARDQCMKKVCGNMIKELKNRFWKRKCLRRVESVLQRRRRTSERRFDNAQDKACKSHSSGGSGDQDWSDLGL